VTQKTTNGIIKGLYKEKEENVPKESNGGHGPSHQVE